MKPSLRLRPEAEADLEGAFAWYKEQRAALGRDFLLAVEVALTHILEYPESFPVVHRHVRRALLRRFPYGVFYVLKRDEIVVLAVLHARRDPALWQARI